MPFSVRILRLFGTLLLGVCALGVAGITWAYLIEPNLLFVRKVDYRVPQWNGRGKPVKVVIAGDLHLMPTAFDEVRALRYVRRIMQLQPDLILLVGDYARGASRNASMSPAAAARLLRGLAAPCSGHTHGGQIRLPFNLLWFEASPEHAQPYTYPWHISGGNTYLITKGLGTSTLPLRFNCPPEIYLLELH